MKIDWSPTPNCDVSDLNPGDLVAWEGRALPVVYVREIPPVDWREDEKPGQLTAFGMPVTDELPPAVMKLDDGTTKGLCLRIGFRRRRSRTVHRKKYLYRVTADFPTGWGDSTFQRVWHYQSKSAAQNRVRMARSGWSRDYGPEDGYTMPPATSVRLERSALIEGWAEIPPA